MKYLLFHLRDMLNSLFADRTHPIPEDYLKAQVLQWQDQGIATRSIGFFDRYKSNETVNVNLVQNDTNLRLKNDTEIEKRIPKIQLRTGHWSLILRKKFSLGYEIVTIVKSRQKGCLFLVQMFEHICTFCEVQQYKKPGDVTDGLTVP